MNSDTPKATKVVWNRQPVHNPKTVNTPAFFPLYKELDKTNILSGPGDNAMKKLAIVKEKITSNLIYVLSKNKLFLYSLSLHFNTPDYEIYILNIYYNILFSYNNK